MSGIGQWFSDQYEKAKSAIQGTAQPVADQVVNKNIPAPVDLGMGKEEPAVTSGGGRRHRKRGGKTRKMKKGGRRTRKH